MGGNMAKKMVCYCQDLTDSDLKRAIDEGYDHLELLKRYTGAFMGTCQGKMCTLNVLKLFAEITGQSIENLKVTTIRPPVEPIPLGWLALEDD
jgi:bacterioferritin-associated ferredoxin